MADLDSVSPRTKEVSADFIFRNVGLDAFRIASVEVDKDVLNSVYTRSNIAKGEYGFVKVRFTPGGTNGLLNELVKVSFVSDEDSIWVYLNFKAFVTEKMTTDSIDLIQQDSEISTTVNVTDNDLKNIEKPAEKSPRNSMARAYELELKRQREDMAELKSKTAILDHLSDSLRNVVANTEIEEERLRKNLQLEKNRAEALVTKLQGLDGTIRQGQSRMDSVELEIAKAKNERKRYMDEVEKLRTRKLGLEKLLAETNQNTTTEVDSLRGLIQELSDTTAQNVAIENMIYILENERKAVKEFQQAYVNQADSLGKLTASVEHYQEAFQEKESKLSGLNSKLGFLEEELIKAAALDTLLTLKVAVQEKQISLLKQDKNALRNRVGKLSNQMNTVQSIQDSLQGVYRNQVADNAILQDSLATQTSKLNEQNIELDKLRTRNTQMSKKLDVLSEEYRSKIVERDSVAKAISKIETTLDGQQAIRQGERDSLTTVIEKLAKNQEYESEEFENLKTELRAALREKVIMQDELNRKRDEIISLESLANTKTTLQQTSRERIAELHSKLQNQYGSNQKYREENEQLKKQLRALGLEQIQSRMGQRSAEEELRMLKQRNKQQKSGSSADWFKEEIGELQQELNALSKAKNEALARVQALERELENERNARIAAEKFAKEMQSIATGQ